jgi:hypothetical protein
MDSLNIPQETIQKEEAPVLAQSAQSPVNQTQSQEKPENIKTIFTVILLVLIYPIGLILMWIWMKWPRWAKIVISLPLFLAILGIVVSALLMTINPIKQLNQAKCAEQCASSENVNICRDTCLKTLQ